MSRHQSDGPSKVKWVRKGMKKGKVLNRLNNGWFMLQFEDGSKNRYPPSMLTDQGPKEEEKAVDTPAAAQPSAQPQAAPQPVVAAPTMQSAVPQTYQPPVFQQNTMQPAQPVFANYQDRKLPAPTAGVQEVQQWLTQNGFGHHVKDAQDYRVDGWSFRYLQHMARTSTPKEFSMIMRQHFPRMTIGQISSMGGRLLYKPGESAWD